MNKTDLKAALARWNQPGAAGFLTFIEDVKPQVPSHGGGHEVYIPTKWELEHIKSALDGGYSTIVWCWPRRHGKTLTNSLLCVWRFMSRQAENIAIVANSEKQVLSTCFKTIRDIIEKTKFTAALVKSGAIVVGADKILFTSTGSTIAAYSNNPASLWGKKLTCAQASEVHEFKNQDIVTALAGSLLDTKGSMLLIDSTVSAKSSYLHTLYELHRKGEDKTVFFSYISYADVEDACAKQPPWIDANNLRFLARTTLPAKFNLLHLNRWSDASNALFPAEILDRCRQQYPLNVTELTKGIGHVVGAGVDRARPFSKHGDATICSCVVKAVLNDEEHFFVLASDQITMSMASGIKKRLSEYHRQHGMKRVCFETYETADLAAWAGDQPFNHESVQPNSDKQLAAFTSLYAAAAEGRLHIHPQFKKLLEEMEIFEHQINKGGRWSFGHPPNKHDDTVFALAWAVYSLRDEELNPYEMRGIACNATGNIARLCPLQGGDIVPLCADQCRSMFQAQQLYQAYLSRAGCAPMSFPDFFRNKVVNIGAHTIRR